MIFNRFERMTGHVGPETTPKEHIVPSSRESWTMGASLIQLYGVDDEGANVVKSCLLAWIATASKNKYRLTPVPEASVILGVQVLLEMIVC